MLKVICTPFEPCEMDDITMVARAEKLCKMGWVDKHCRSLKSVLTDGQAKQGA